MNNPKSSKLQEKYEYCGQISLPRPDLNVPEGWSLALLGGVNRIRNHALSPDGEWIAYIWDQGDTSDVYLISTSGGWPVRVSFGRGPTISWDDELPAWSPDSQWLAFTQSDHVHVAPAMKKGRIPVSVTDFSNAASSPVWAASPDGSAKIIVSVDRRGATQLVMTDRDGAWPLALTDDPLGDAWDPRPSPDGRWVVYVFRTFDDLNRLDLRAIETDSRKITTIAGSPSTRIQEPSWSPSGSQLAFLSQASGFYEIWIAGVDKAGLWTVPHQLTRAGMDFADLAWSPDGRRIACTLNRDGNFELVVVSVDTGEVEILRNTTGVHARPNWLPDGRSLTFEYESPLQPPDLYRFFIEEKILTQLTYSMPPALAGLNLLLPELVSYRSFDETEIPGLIFRPTLSNGAGIVMPHGGPGDQSIFMWDGFTQYLVACGYTIVEPNYRGSTGYGADYERKNYFDWGGGDVGDCLAAADFLAQQPGIDRRRLGSMGASYGGYLTNAVLARDPYYRFACGISIFGDANLLTSWAQCSQRLRLYSEIYLGNPAEFRQVYTDGSPVFQAASVQSPVLLLHGLEDDIVPPEASEEWASALRAEGKTYEYKTYAGEPHGFLRRVNRLDAWDRICRFLNWHLLPKRIAK